MMLDRANSMYQRDKNHAAILIWSCGNESFGGKDIFEMSQFFHKEDPTRLVHYEGLCHDRRYNDTSDMESQMYPSVEAIKEFLAKDSSKPFICCEYTHAMGNSCGAMHKYTDLTDTEPKYQGGFIWDYIDQSIYKKTATAKNSRHTAVTSENVRQITTSVEMVSHTVETGMLLQRCRKSNSITMNITAEVGADSVKSHQQEPVCKHRYFGLRSNGCKEWQGDQKSFSCNSSCSIKRRNLCTSACKRRETRRIYGDGFLPSERR